MDYAPQTRTVGIREEITELEEAKTFKVDNKDPKRGKAKIDMTITGLGIPPVKVTPNGLPSVDVDSLHQLAGSPKEGKYGLAFEHFKSTGNEEFGKSLCEALETLI